MSGVKGLSGRKPKSAEIELIECDAEVQTQVTKVPNYKNKTRIPISFRNKREYHR